jgi:hypothetical protein
LHWQKAEVMTEPPVFARNIIWITMQPSFWILTGTAEAVCHAPETAAVI